jgi:hypothetical protein
MKSHDVHVSMSSGVTHLKGRLPTPCILQMEMLQAAMVAAVRTVVYKSGLHMSILSHVHAQRMFQGKLPRAHARRLPSLNGFVRAASLHAAAQQVVPLRHQIRWDS